VPPDVGFVLGFLWIIFSPDTIPSDFIEESGNGSAQSSANIPQGIILLEQYFNFISIMLVEVSVAARFF